MMRAYMKLFEIVSKRFVGCRGTHVVHRKGLSLKAENLLSL